MDAIKLVNLTPHPVTIRDRWGVDHTFPSEGVARVASTPGAVGAIPGLSFDVALPTTFGEVEGLPPKGGKVFYIVSALVGGALKGTRKDVMMLGTGPNDGAIRNEQGHIVAVTRLVMAG